MDTIHRECSFALKNKGSGMIKKSPDLGIFKNLSDFGTWCCAQDAGNDMRCKHMLDQIF